MDPWVHVIAGLALLSRMADIWTTYLVTPSLRLEGNAIAARLGWPYAFATVLIGLLAYVSVGLGIVIITASFLVAAANASKIVMARALGEDKTVELWAKMIEATRLWPGLLYLLLPGIFTALLGGTMLIFYNDPNEAGYYFAMGMMAYALAVFVWSPLRFIRVKRRGQASTLEERS